jgi:hypothetical protein
MQNANDETVNHISFMLTKPRVPLSMNQDFNDEVDRLDPFICPRDDLSRLLEAAPSEFASGYLCAVYDFRTQLAVVTARSF